MKETIESQGQFEQYGRSNVLKQEYPTVIYNRVPKTGSTAFTQIAYKLVKGKWLFTVSRSKGQLNVLTLIGKSWKTHPEIFLGISVLRVISQTVLMESSSNFISKFQFRGHESDCFTGKIIHANFMSYSVLVKYRVRR